MFTDLDICVWLQYYCAWFFFLHVLFHLYVCVLRGVIGGIDRWPALMWIDRSCLIWSKGEGECWHCPTLLCLCSIESCIYSFAVFLPKRSSITPLIDVRSVFALLWLAQIYLSLSPLWSSCFHPPSSSLSQTVTGGGCALHFSASLLSSTRCLFLCAIKWTECQGAPHEFPASGSDPKLLGRLRRCDFFFTCLKLSGGKEFTFRVVDVGQGGIHTLTHTHRQYGVQSQQADWVMLGE